MAGLSDFDPTAAFFSGAAALWKKMIAFIVANLLGTFVGMNFCTAPAFVRDLATVGLAAFDGLKAEAILFVPLIWLWNLVSGCSSLMGLLYLPILAAAFLIVWISEDRWSRGILLILLAGPAHTIGVMHRSTVEDGMLPFVLALLVVWWALIGAVSFYWAKARAGEPIFPED